MIPIFEKAVTWRRPPRHEDHGGERRRRLDLPLGTQALEIVALVKQAQMTPAAAIAAATVKMRTVLGMGSRSARCRRASSRSGCGPGDPLADITELTRVKFVIERRQGHPQRAHAEHGGLTLNQ